MEHFDAVVEGCTACTIVGASVRNYNGKVVYGTQSSTDTLVRGWTPGIRGSTTWISTPGAPSTRPIWTRLPVVVIGSDIRENLLSGTDPIGKEIRVDGHLYRVIGVGTKRGKTLGQSADNWVMMPISTWFKAYGTHNSLNIWAKTDGVGAPMEQAIDQARVIMRSRRHDPSAEKIASPSKPTTASWLYGEA